MTGPWKGAGASIGEGLAMFTQSFIQRQDQLKQQHLQEEQYRQQLAQQELQNQRQREQMDLQARQQQQSEAAQAFQQQYQQGQMDRQGRLDALGQREDELTKVLSPQVNTFMQGVQADLQRYAPTLSDGRPNPQYNPALFEAAQARSKQVKKLWSTLSLSVGAGQGYEEAKAALLGFVGGDVQPAMPAAGPAMPTAQPAMPTAATPAPVTVTEPGGASFGYTPEAAPQAAPSADMGNPITPTPVTSDMPANITQIAPSQLMEMDDAQITARYGQGGLEYANAARTQYAAQVQAQNAAAAKTRADAWDIQLKELAKDTTLTGPQRFAALRISDLMSRPTLTPQEQQDLRDAFALLTPVMYTAASWQKVLDTKDPMVILAQLPVYQAHAPQVVAGFDPEPLIQAGQSTLDKNAADAAQSSGAARKSNADADRTTALLPGELAQQGADLAKTNATTAGTVATTAQTQQATQTAAYDLGVKKLSQIAGTGATVYQIQQSNPGLWYELKQSLNVNDAGLTALLQQARYEYNQGIQGKDLENRLRAAQINLAGAQTGKAIADTAETTALLPGKVAQQGAQTGLIVAQTGKAEADATRTATLTPLEAGQIAASTSLNWARVGEIQQNLKLDREKTAAYIKGVEGKYAVDMAQVGNLTARTALARAENPNDPLYNPVVAASKPGDPIDALKKKAGVFYTQADQALKQANSLNSQINGLVKQGEGVTGVFDRTRLSAADQQKLDALTKQRDDLFKRAQDARQKGDNVFTQGMGSLGDVATPAPTQGATQTPFKRLTAAPNVKLGGVSTALVNRMDNMLAGFTAPGGLIPVITQGVRTKEEQDALYAKGRTTPGPNARPGKPMGDIVTNAKGGESNHNGGMAVDISWKDPKTGKILSGTDPRAQTAWKALGTRAPQFGLRWGGTFPGLVDMYHFEVYGDFKLPPTATTPARPVSPPAKPATTSAAAPTGPLPGIKRPRMDQPSLAVASRAEQALTRALKGGDNNTVFSMYTQLVNLGYDSGAVLAYINANKVQK